MLQLWAFLYILNKGISLIQNNFDSLQMIMSTLGLKMASPVDLLQSIHVRINAP